jgi:flagellar basal-body rod protein FlgC
MNSSILEISAAGLDLERRRVEAAALNLANANTAAATQASAYQPLRVVASPASAFAGMMSASDGLPGLIPRAHLEATPGAPRRVHEPGNPLADADGFVFYPDVDAAGEMMTLLAASRAYEANVAALNTSRAMEAKALDIGSGS